MHGHARSGLGHVSLANARGNIVAIEQHTVPTHAGLELDARVLRQLEQRSLVLKGNVPFDRFERERAVHGAALKIDVAQLAC